MISITIGLILIYILLTKELTILFSIFIFIIGLHTLHLINEYKDTIVKKGKRLMINDLESLIKGE